MSRTVFLALTLRTSSSRDESRTRTRPQSAVLSVTATPTPTVTPNVVEGTTRSVQTPGSEEAIVITGSVWRVEERIRRRGELDRAIRDPR